MKSRMYEIPADEFRCIVQESHSVREALNRMGFVVEGSMYRIFYRRCEAEGIDVDELKKRTTELHREQSVDRARNRKIPLDEILVEGSSYYTNDLKRRLIAEGMVEEVCAVCGLGPLWNGLPLVLVLDHINGVNNDHRRENLRLLCPNCNSQTETFSGKHKKRTERLCVDCGKPIHRSSTRCHGCANVAKHVAR